MEVAVLGCGPAGMMAAHACARAGVDFTIISNKARSKIGGAQYLHKAIPGATFTQPDGVVNFYRQGHPQVYASKVYGDPCAPTSWDSFDPGAHDIWNMQRAYETLWAVYHTEIHNQVITEESQVRSLLDRYDMILSTIPRIILCQSGHHTFTKQDVWIDVDPGSQIDEDSIIYNGQRNVPWYRASNIFGVSSVEYGENPGPSEAVVRVQKPLVSDCDCWVGTDQFVPLGRYGMWQKGILIHDAFDMARDILRTEAGV